MLRISEAEPAFQKVNVGLGRKMLVPIARIGAGRNQGKHHAGVSPLHLAARLGDPGGKLAAIGRVHENDSVPRER